MSVICHSFVSKLQIRETPRRSDCKFIEYYDVRAAESALRALNRSVISGKQIKLEASRPGGARRWYCPTNLDDSFFDLDLTLLPLFYLHFTPTISPC